MTSALPRSSFRNVLAATWVALLVLGCASTPESRIADEQALFDTWPADVQAKVRAGQVDLGMTEDQVRLALGEPDETSTGIDEAGETITWTWASSSPGLSVGLGGGGGSGGGFGGVGLGVGSGSKRNLERVVQFRNGEVVSSRVFD